MIILSFKKAKMSVLNLTYHPLRRTEGKPITLGFVQLGQDVVAIIGSAYPSFISGGRNSVGQ